MDKIIAYRTSIKKVLTSHADFILKGYEEYENQVVSDDQQGHYFLMRLGWKGANRKHSCVIHMDLKKDKIWIQEDWTEEGVANELVKLGIPSSDIVLAYYAPYRRKDTEFAVA